jgi:hypothetical protein
MSHYLLFERIGHKNAVASKRHAVSHPAETLMIVSIRI